MNETDIQVLIQKMQDTYEAGKPFIEEFSERWLEQQSFLQMLRFLLSTQPSPDLAGQTQKTLYLGQLDQIIRDVTALFSALSVYQGLTLALKSILQDYQEEKLKGEESDQANER